jgi:hypothetical protein
MNLSTKILLILTLIVGGAVGFGVDYTITKPQIEELQHQLNTTTDQLEILREEFDELSESHNQLEDDYQEIQESTVPRENYSSLLRTKNQLEAENDLIRQQLGDTREDLEELNKTYILLKDMYDSLLEEYNRKVLPETAQTIINELVLNLAIDQITVDHLEPLTGTVTIQHIDGEPFEGNITFSIKSEYFDLFKVGYRHEIMGATSYSISNAFQWGAGRYSVGLDKIMDEDGNVLASHNELNDFRLQFEVT